MTSTSLSISSIIPIFIGTSHAYNNIPLQQPILPPPPAPAAFQNAAPLPAVAVAPRQAVLPVLTPAQRLISFISLFIQIIFCYVYPNLIYAVITYQVIIHAFIEYTFPGSLRRIFLNVKRDFYRWTVDLGSTVVYFWFLSRDAMNRLAHALNGNPMTLDPVPNWNLIEAYIDLLIDSHFSVAPVPPHLGNIPLALLVTQSTFTVALDPTVPNDFWYISTFWPHIAPRLSSKDRNALMHAMNGNTTPSPFADYTELCDVHAVPAAVAFYETVIHNERTLKLTRTFENNVLTELKFTASNSDDANICYHANAAGAGLTRLTFHFLFQLLSKKDLNYIIEFLRANPTPRPPDTTITPDQYQTGSQPNTVILNDAPAVEVISRCLIQAVANDVRMTFCIVQNGTNPIEFKFYRLCDDQFLFSMPAIEDSYQILRALFYYLFCLLSRKELNKLAHAINGNTTRRKLEARELERLRSESHLYRKLLAKSHRPRPQNFPVENEKLAARYAPLVPHVDGVLFDVMEALVYERKFNTVLDVTGTPLTKKRFQRFTNILEKKLSELTPPEDIVQHSFADMMKPAYDLFDDVCTTVKSIRFAGSVARGVKNWLDDYKSSLAGFLDLMTTFVNLISFTARKAWTELTLNVINLFVKYSVSPMFNLNPAAVTQCFKLLQLQIKGQLSQARASEPSSSSDKDDLYPDSDPEIIDQHNGGKTHIATVFAGFLHSVVGGIDNVPDFVKKAELVTKTTHAILSVKNLVIMFRDVCVFALEEWKKRFTMLDVPALTEADKAKILELMRDVDTISTYDMERLDAPKAKFIRNTYDAFAEKRRIYTINNHPVPNLAPAEASFARLHNFNQRAIAFRNAQLYRIATKIIMFIGPPNIGKSRLSGQVSVLLAKLLRPDHPDPQELVQAHNGTEKYWDNTDFEKLLICQIDDAFADRDKEAATKLGMEWINIDSNVPYYPVCAALEKKRNQFWDALGVVATGNHFAHPSTVTLADFGALARRPLFFFLDVRDGVNYSITDGIDPSSLLPNYGHLVFNLMRWTPLPAPAGCFELVQEDVPFHEVISICYEAINKKRTEFTSLSQSRVPDEALLARIRTSIAETRVEGPIVKKIITTLTEPTPAPDVDIPPLVHEDDEDFQDVPESPNITRSYQSYLEALNSSPLHSRFEEYSTTSQVSSAPVINQHMFGRVKSWFSPPKRTFPLTTASQLRAEFEKFVEDPKLSWYAARSGVLSDKNLTDIFDKAEGRADWMAQACQFLDTNATHLPPPVKLQSDLFASSKAKEDLSSPIRKFLSDHGTLLVTVAGTILTIAITAAVSYFVSQPEDIDQQYYNDGQPKSHAPRIFRGKLNTPVKIEQHSQPTEILCDFDHIEDIVQQSAVDKGKLEMVAKILRNYAHFSFRLRGDDTIQPVSTLGIFLRGRSVLLQAHVPAICAHSDPFEIVMTRVGAPQRIIQSRDVHFVTAAEIDERADLAVMTFTRASDMPLAPDITHLIPETLDERHLGDLFQLIPTESLDRQGFLVPVPKIEIHGPVASPGDGTAGGKIITAKCFAFEGISGPGLCGGALLALNQPQPFIGSYFGATTASRPQCLAALLYRSKVMAMLPKDAIPLDDKVVGSPLAVKQHIRLEAHFLLGTVSKEFEYRRPLDSKIIPSLIYKQLEIDDMCPAHLKRYTNRHGVKLDPWKLGLERWSIPRPNPSTRFNDALDFAKRYLWYKIENLTPKYSNLLTHEEVLNAHPLIDKTSVDLNTSIGHILKRRFPGPGKHGAIIMVNDRKIPTPAYAAEVQQRRDILQSGQYPFTMATAIIKDELHPTVKAEDQGKGRIFLACDSASADISAIHTTQYETTVLVSMNAGFAGHVDSSSFDWDAIYTKVTCFSDGELLAVDISRNDSSFLTATRAAAQELKAKWNQKHLRMTPAEVVESNMLANDYGCEIVAFESDVYALGQGFESGRRDTFATVTTGCKLENIMNVVDMLVQNNMPVTFDTIDNAYSGVNFGDDSLACINTKQYPFLTTSSWCVNYKDLTGRVLTTTNKDGKEVSKVTIKDAELLKRGFVIRDGVLFAPLRLSVIHNISNWIEPGRRPYDACTREVVEAALREYFHHGVTVFNTNKKRLNKALVEAHLEPVNLDFLTLLAAWARKR